MIVLALLLIAAVALLFAAPVASMILFAMAAIRLVSLLPETSCTGNCNQGRRACTCQPMKD